MFTRFVQNEVFSFSRLSVWIIPWEYQKTVANTFPGDCCVFILMKLFHRQQPIILIIVCPQNCTDESKVSSTVIKWRLNSKNCFEMSTRSSCRLIVSSRGSHHSARVRIVFIKFWFSSVMDLLMVPSVVTSIGLSERSALQRLVRPRNSVNHL